MGTFNSSLFNAPQGGTSGGSALVGVQLSSIIGRAYRISGITKWVGTTPGGDWTAEAIAELNALIGGKNTDRLNIFTTQTYTFPCGGGKKAWTVGIGADFSMPHPIHIERGVIILAATTPGAVRMPPMYAMNDEEWANVPLQDVANGVPLAYYYDESFDPTTGYGVVNLWPQTTQSYQVEWYVWQPIPKFQTATDLVALPDGYEDFLVYNLAERLAALNPHMAKMDPQSYAIARKTRAAIQHANAIQPKVVSSDSECAGRTGGSSGHWDYRIGQSR